MQNVAIFEGARLGLVGVADDIDRLGVGGGDEAPLHSGRKASTATPTQTRFLHLVGDVSRSHSEGFFELRIAAVAQVAVDGRVIACAIDVLEDQAMLARMRFFARKIGDCGGHGALSGYATERQEGFVKNFTSASPADTDRR
jgi:hypothetical protein